MNKVVIIIHSTSPLYPLHIAPLSTLHRSFTHSTDALKSQIQKAEDAKNDCAKTHHLPQEERDKGLAEVEQQRKIVDKLQKFADELKKTGNDNILTHLCDGLEKFLGYDKTSKGYNGQGIVYSDLDRLCDAVMGFLSGVLSNIKGHLGQHKDKIEPVIKVLEQNKHAGKKGFNAAIGSVVAGVRGYNERVKESNKKVSDVITKMQKDADKYAAEALHKNLPQNAENSKQIVHLIQAANETVEECLTKADKFNEALDMKNNPEELRNAIKDLNPNLSTKIQNVRENIKHERERLNTLAQHEKLDLQRMEEQIKIKLHDVKCKVNEHIKKKVKDLVERLKDRVREMQTKLVDINVDLTTHLEKLEKWMKQVKEFVETARKRSEAIMDEVKWDDTNTKNAKRNKIDNAATHLRKRAQQLLDAGNAAINAVNRDVTTALGQVKDMDDALKKDLYRVKTAVEGQVEKIKEAIGKLYDVVKNGDAGSGVVDVRDKTLVRIVEEIKEKVVDITGGSGRGPKSTIGLWETLRKVQTYVKTYQKFETKVESWVRDIVTKNTDVTSHMLAYVSANEQYFQGALKGNLDGQNAAKVKVKLIDKITNALKLIAQAAQNSIQTNGQMINDLRHIKTFFDAFSGSTLQGKIGHIVADIEGVEGLNMDTVRRGYPLNSDLKTVVRCTLQAVSTATEKLSEQINELISNCKLANINTALTAADTLEKNLGSSLRQPGKSTPPAAAVDSAITEVINELKKHFPNEGDSKVTLDKDHTFAQYNACIDQTEGKLAAPSNSDFEAIKAAGSLPAAIGAIRENMNLDFEAACKETVNLTIFNDLSRNLKNTLKTLVEAFSDAGKEVKEQLEIFRTHKIGKTAHGGEAARNTLQKLQKNLLDLLTRKLEPVIKLANKCIRSDADVFKKGCIDSLTRHVNTESQEATNKLITQANKNYVTSVKDMLTAFADKVQKELKPLPGEIDTDRQHGFKGFMRTLQGAIGENGETSDENIDKLKGLVGQLSGHVTHKDAFKNLSHKFKDFWSPLHGYLSKEIKRVHEANQEKANPKPTGEETLHTSKLHAANTALNTILDHIHTHNRYNHEVPEIIDSLSNKVDDLHPESLNDPSTPLLDGVGKGLGEFAAALGTAYINRYEGSKNIVWDENASNDSGNCAKITLTIIDVLDRDLGRLRGDCSVNASSNKKLFLVILLVSGSRIVA